MASAVVPAPTALVYLNGKGVSLLDKVSIHRENGAIAGYGRVQQIELGSRNIHVQVLHPFVDFRGTTRAVGDTFRCGVEFLFPALAVTVHCAASIAFPHCTVPFSSGETVLDLKKKAAVGLQWMGWAKAKCMRWTLDGEILEDDAAAELWQADVVCTLLPEKPKLYWAHSACWQLIFCLALCAERRATPKDGTTNMGCWKNMVAGMTKLPHNLQQYICKLICQNTDLPHVFFTTREQEARLRSIWQTQVEAVGARLEEERSATQEYRKMSAKGYTRANEPDAPVFRRTFPDNSWHLVVTDEEGEETLEPPLDSLSPTGKEYRVGPNPIPDDVMETIPKARKLEVRFRPYSASIDGGCPGYATVVVDDSSTSLIHKRHKYIEDREFEELGFARDCSCPLPSK